MTAPRARLGRSEDWIGMARGVLTIPVSPDHHLQPLLLHEGTKMIMRDRQCKATLSSNENY
jgi:hypothetical protein